MPIKQLFEKVFIKSESDLPKEEGVYFCYHKTGRMSNETFRFDTIDTAWISWWLVNIASYLQPIEQPAEKYQSPDYSFAKENQLSPAMSPKPQEEITEFNADLKQYITNALYAAYTFEIENKLVTNSEFDEFVEREVNGLDEYFNSNPSPVIHTEPVTDEMIEKWAKEFAEGRTGQMYRLMKLSYIKGATELRSQMTVSRRDELAKFRLFWNRIPNTGTYIDESVIDLYLTSLNQKEK